MIYRFTVSERLGHTFEVEADSLEAAENILMAQDHEENPALDTWGVAFEIVGVEEL